MEITLKNVKKKDLPVLKALAKRLGFEITINKEKTKKSRFLDENLDTEIDNK